MATTVLSSLSLAQMQRLTFAKSEGANSASLTPHASRLMHRPKLLILPPVQPQHVPRTEISLVARGSLELLY